MSSDGLPPDEPRGFRAYVRDHLGVEPSPDFDALGCAIHRAKVNACLTLWMHLGLRHHEGRLPFAPRAQVPPEALLPGNHDSGDEA